MAWLPLHAQEGRTDRIYRVVDGRFWVASCTDPATKHTVTDPHWQRVSGAVQEVITNTSAGSTVILVTTNGPFILKHVIIDIKKVNPGHLSELQSGVISGMTLSNKLAMRVAVMVWKGTQYDTWDCGESYHWRKAPEEKAAAKQMAEEKRKVAKVADQKRISEEQIRSFNAIYARATNGNVSMQYSLAIRYLNGEGCETNQTEAIRWLNTASTNGNAKASRKLAALKVQ